MAKPYERDPSEQYDIFMSRKVTQLAPLIALCAALTFSVAHLYGLFPSVSTLTVLLFDGICLVYLLIGFIVLRIGITKDGRIDPGRYLGLRVSIVLLILLQWNLISYLFPSEDFWGYAPFFILLGAFFYNYRTVLFLYAGILISVAVSWIIKGPELLPTPNEYFSENLLLRSVVIVLSGVTVALITYFGERFKKQASARNRKLNENIAKLKDLNDEIIEFAADLLESRDQDSGEHIRRVRTYSLILAERVAESHPEYRLDRRAAEQIGKASVLHDIGKIKVSDAVLLKPDRLTEEETQEIRMHCRWGAEIVDKLPKEMSPEFIRYAREICLYHHERYDGSGYPEGLAGDAIPISAQIVALADCLDALTQSRVYREPCSREEAIRMIRGGECGAFNERLLQCLDRCYRHGDFPAE